MHGRKVFSNPVTYTYVGIYVCMYIVLYGHFALFKPGARWPPSGFLKIDLVQIVGMHVCVCVCVCVCVSVPEAINN